MSATMAPMNASDITITTTGHYGTRSVDLDQAEWGELVELGHLVAVLIAERDAEAVLIA